MIEYVDVNKFEYEEAVKVINNPNINLHQLRNSYSRIKKILDEYDISSRSI